MVRERGLVAPRVSAPDLPSMLDGDDVLSAGVEAFRTRWEALGSRTDAARASVSECVVDGADCDSIDLRDATLVDVVITDLRATTITARGARLRRVRIAGGRIGTLDLADADIDELELDGVRIDYLSLARAKATDLIVADCHIRTLDVPQATFTRVRFDRAQADEVDTRGMRSQHVDLRGLAAAAYTDVTALGGATLDEAQLAGLLPELAAALGIRIG